MDIRLNQTFKDHRKRKRLCAELGPAAVLALVDLWLSVAENRPDGNLAGMDDTDIELLSNWVGMPGRLIESLKRLKFIDGETGSFKIHNWEKNQPWIVGFSKRSEHGKKAIKVRWENRENTRSIPGVTKSDTPLLSSPLLPINTEKNTSLVLSAEVPANQTKKEKIGFVFESATWTGINGTHHELWGKAFPAVNIDQELARAANWLIANPKNKKSNYAKFLNGWMGRAQDKAPGQRGPQEVSRPSRVEL